MSKHLRRNLLTEYRPAVPEDFFRRLAPPFDVYASLRTRLVRTEPHSPVQTLEDLLQGYGIEASHFYSRRTPFPTIRQVLRVYDLWHAPTASGLGKSPAERIVLQCAAFGWTPEDVAELALGPALPLREAVRQCQFKAPELWPKAAYVLLGRTDQTVLLGKGRRKEVRYHVGHRHRIS